MSINLDAWRDKVLKPLLSGRKPSTEDVKQLGGPALLSADTDRVQDYVFESARLPEVRGASMLLQDLNKEAAELVERAVGPDCVIYAGGGSLLAIVPDDADLLSELKHKIEALYPQRTGVATITCIVQPATADALLDGYGGAGITPDAVWALRGRYPNDWQRIAAAYRCFDYKAVGEADFKSAVEGQRGFGQMVRVAGVKLRRRKDDRPLMAFHEALPHAQRCSSCRRRPAAQMGRLHEDPWPICGPCARKLEERYADRSYWLNEFLAYLGSQPDLQTVYYQGFDPGTVNLARDIGEIGQACRTRGGYVGFIYADGNSIGRYLETCRTPVQFKKASQALHKGTRTAVFRALADLTRPADVEREKQRGKKEPVTIHPFEIITIGGDDVLLIVPGDVTLPLALHVCRLFGEGMNGHRLPDGKPITMSAGVVIADEHNPVRALRDIAEQLKGSAKRRTHDENGAPALDFLVLKSQSMLRRDLRDLRAAYPITLTDEGVKGALRLTGTPYTLDETLTLLRLLRRMRLLDFPTSQLQQLVAALYEGRERSSLFYLYQQARLHSRESGAILEEIEKLPLFGPEKDPIPWKRITRGAETIYTTILPDLADLYPFIPAKDRLQLWDVILKEVPDAVSS